LIKHLFLSRGYELNHDKIAVVDFGGQTAHLIATKVREIGVLAEILQPTDPVEAFAGYRGIILSGSPSLSSHGEDSDWTKEVLDLDVPILGFCFGHQEIAKHYGGKVIHGGREWGHAQLHIRRPHPLFEGLGAEETVWMSHFDSVVELGPEFEELGYSVGSEGTHANAAIGSDSLRRYGFQYHAEVDDTVNGQRMMSNFVKGICGCQATWDMKRYVDSEVAQIVEQVGDRSVFMLVSGGVDSTVAAKLLGIALPKDRLKLLHIDNGLMRKNESAQVLALFDRLELGHALHFTDATDDFIAALEGLVEPEAKRRAIGDTFIEVFDREAQRLGQGTIYPDTIESGGTKRAHVIKTHHNRVPIVEQMIAAGRVIEPLADLYKTEVRELAHQLGIPHDLAWRHPFPGPGLGVRLLCSDGDDSAPDVQTQLTQLTEGSGIVAQAMPVKSVGVKADIRSYEHPALLTGQTDWESLL
jgi:GMP synthase (glutamine-hydrolysing)